MKLSKHDLEFLYRFKLETRSALKAGHIFTPKRETLLFLTACHESHFCQYVRQIGGPAIGLYQIEPSTHDDIRDYIFNRSTTLPYETKHMAMEWGKHLDLVIPRYATVIAACKYYMDPDPIPGTIEGMAKYYKRVYNSSLGKGSEEDIIKVYSTLQEHGLCSLPSA